MKKFDLAAMETASVKQFPRDPPTENLLVPDECTSCGGSDFDFSDKQVTCKECGCVQRQMLDYRERRAFTEEQARARSTTSATSYLSSSKNLGSVIGACGKDRQDERVRRLLLAERKLANEITDNELREVIRIFSIIADSNNLGLTRREIEDLIITYRKRFLGSKISIGRPRYAVLLAFTFLEIRNKHRNYLSYNEFLVRVNLSRFDKKLDCIQEREMAVDFQSAVMYFVKEHGYALRQPTVPDMIHHVTDKIRLPPVVATDSVKIWKIVAPYYKHKGVKNAGIAAAIIPAVARAHGMTARKKDINIVFPGTASTAKFRAKEIRKYLEIRLERMERVRGAPGNASAVIGLITRYLGA